jgi:hypothetical protein
MRDRVEVDPELGCFSLVHVERVLQARFVVGFRLRVMQRLERVAVPARPVLVGCPVRNVAARLLTVTANK